MINCIIVEDQPPAQRILKKYIENVSYLNLIGTFSNAIDASSFLKSNKVDLMFLDIHLPKISGLDFLNIIVDKPNVILTTAFSEYALKGYEYDVVDYLLKPFSFERFLKSVEKVHNKLFVQEKEDVISNPSIYIKSGFEHIKINLNDILFIKSDSDYTEIHLVERTILSSDTLKSWKEKYKDEFIQIHKSFLVNKSKIEKISAQFVFITNQEKLQIGRAYKNQVEKLLD